MADAELRLTETPYRAPNLAVAPAFWVLFANQFASFSATIFLSSAHFFWAPRISLRILAA